MGVAASFTTTQRTYCMTATVHPLTGVVICTMDDGLSSSTPTGDVPVRVEKLVPFVMERFGVTREQAIARIRAQCAEYGLPTTDAGQS